MKTTQRVGIIVGLMMVGMYNLHPAFAFDLPDDSDTCITTGILQWKVGKGGRFGMAVKKDFSMNILIFCRNSQASQDNIQVAQGTLQGAEDSLKQSYLYGIDSEFSRKGFRQASCFWDKAEIEEKCIYVKVCSKDVPSTIK